MVSRRGIAIGLLVLSLFLIGRLFSGSLGEKLPSLSITRSPRHDLFVVYFAAGQATVLVPEFRLGDGSIAGRLAALVAGPSSPKHLPILPKGTKVLGYWHEESTLFVDFSSELVVNHPGGSSGELVTVYGIVNSLTEIRGIQRVQITVEGQTIDTLAGHIDLASPLERDWSMVRGRI